MQRALTPRMLLGFAVLCALAAAALARSAADRQAFLALNDAAFAALPAALPSSLTILGHGLVAVMLLAPFLRSAPGVLGAGLIAAPLGGVFSAVAKRIFHEPRPAAVLDPGLFHVHGELLRGNNSLPSGHAITIFLVATVVLLGAPSVRARAPWALAVMALAVLVAASRVMVGAHWPADTLAGAALGILAGVSGSWAAGRLDVWGRPRSIALLALLVLACAVALTLADTGYPAALPVQWGSAALGAGAAAWALLHLWRARGAEQ